ncbi:helix-turn-helix transcriptional regulator [Xylanibacter rodentium]|uniref:LexA family transcriptional regulator n=1 Tax=Xylanibacter rodentium TaxID=2736289 RepID=UPI002587CE4E|nr:XRE family transcriptional regulator [Xylanibacter rodentium]
MNGTIHERISTLVNVFGEGKNTILASKLDVSEGNIRGYIKGVMPKQDVLEKIVRCFDVNPDWLLTGRGEMEASKASVSFEPSVGVPYYDVDFIGGFDAIWNDQTIIPAHNIVFQPYAKATLWCNVTGRSMEPKINHGDIIALKECTLNDIQYGEIYAVVMDTIHTVKILRKSKDPNKLLFVPVNIDNFDEQEFDKSRIIKVYEVLGGISKFF